ncbi:ferritin, partial [Mycobacterium kansasii]
DVFNVALEHERRVSDSIRDLYRAANDDIDSKSLIQWFVNEQVEEEATVSEIVGRLKLIDGDGPGLLRLDEELGSRPTRTTEA